MKDTITAIATPLGYSAIGIIRISGPQAIGIAKKIFLPIREKDLEKVPSHTLHYGRIYYNDEFIDEVLLAVYKGPNSYTGEDMVEIFTHGSPIILEEVLKIIINEGARIAEKGEFTKRAFLNGKIDLLQAESINEIIRAESKTSLRIALSKLEGDTSKRIRELKDRVEFLRVQLEASIDFPEDVEEKEKSEWIRILEEIKKEVEELLLKGEKGDLIKEGYKVILVGKPNVGKSSLFNSLVREDRAIVTPIPGTTRDYIEGEIYLSGYLIKIYDTAGLSIPRDILDKLGMEKTKKILEKSNIILFVLDGSLEITEEEKNLFQGIMSYENKKVLLVINKIDLPLKIDLSFFPENIERVYVSAKNNIGIDRLEEKLKEYIIAEESIDGLFLNIYHKEELKKINNLIDESIKTLKNFNAIDILGSFLYDIERSLGNMLGEEVSLDIVDKIFENFCVGK